MKRTYENYNPHKMYVSKDSEPDKLLANAFVTITQEQEDFLSRHMDEHRPALYKAFKKRFNSDINKLQFNFALEKVKESAIKPTPIKSKEPKFPEPNVDKARNVYWRGDKGVWDIKFKMQGKTKRIGTSRDHERAKAIAEEYRKKLAAG